MPVVTIDTDELRQLIKESVKEAMEEYSEDALDNETEDTELLEAIHEGINSVNVDKKTIFDTLDSIK